MINFRSVTSKFKWYSPIISSVCGVNPHQKCWIKLGTYMYVVIRVVCLENGNTIGFLSLIFVVQAILPSSKQNLWISVLLFDLNMFYWGWISKWWCIFRFFKGHINLKCAGPRFWWLRRKYSSLPNTLSM